MKEFCQMRFPDESVD